MSDTVTLDAKLDLSAAAQLATMLKENKSNEVVLDFEKVTHLGALCVQVFLAAAKTAAAEDRTISIVNVSDRVIDQLRVMGLTPETIARGPQ